MTRKNDQQGTPFKQNIADLWSAVRGEPRDDGRGWLGAVLHEGLNAFLVEPVRKYPKLSAFILLFLLVALLDCRAVIAAEISTTWTPPTTRSDGTPLPIEEISHYNVYINDNVFGTTIPGTDTSVVLNLPAGNNTINLTTVDTGGRESIFSVGKFVPGFAPKPPTNVTVTTQ